MSEPIRKAVRVRCSVDHAFEVFTGRMDLWWPPTHRFVPGGRIAFECHAGGRFYVRGSDGSERELGHVLRWEPPTRVTYAWLPGGGVGATEVDVTFAPDGDHTLVGVIHAEGPSGLGEQWADRATKFDEAWDEVLPALANHIERGK